MLFKSFSYCLAVASSSPLILEISGSDCMMVWVFTLPNFWAKVARGAISIIIKNSFFISFLMF